MKPTIIVIDDNRKICESLKSNFEKIGYTCLTAQEGEQALHAFRTHELDTAVLDLRLGKENGLDILQKIKKTAPQVPVLILTGYGTIETAVEAIKNGAFDYLQKPVNFTKLQKTVENAVGMYRLTSENQAMQERIHSKHLAIITASTPMLQTLRKIDKLAATELPLLIVGESGTGKELFADYIHQKSDRRVYRLEKINCASFPETLLDNELFGHEKGAYTGANDSFKGVFERAHRGTLFLDEIGDMPLAIQSKILRALQNKEIRRLGGKETRQVDVRFIAATNKDMRELIEKGSFREDLYYRLNAAMVRIPPLRDRMEDIELLCASFLQEISEENERETPRISGGVFRLFHEYAWPGNVRELKNVIQYAGTVATGDRICIEDLPPYLFERAAAKEELNLKDNLEKELILKILKQTNFNKKRAAELLNVCRKTLYNKIEKYGISI
jgi:DNA-binding NtrC family response regulator